MAKPTQEEIDAWNARMNEPDEPDPDDFEVVLFDENGSPVGTMPYARAKAYFKKRGIDFDEQPDAGPAGGNAGNSAGNAGGAPQGSSVSRPPRTSSKYFGKPSAGTQTGGEFQPPDPSGFQQQQQR